MLATLTFWLAAAVAVLALVELLLSKEQKIWLSTKVTEAWNVLDDIKAWSFEDWVTKTRRITGWFAWAAGSVVGAVAAYRYLDLFSSKSAPAGFGDNVYDVIVGPALAFIGLGIFLKIGPRPEQAPRRFMALLL